MFIMANNLLAGTPMNILMFLKTESAGRVSFPLICAKTIAVYFALSFSSESDNICFKPLTFLPVNEINMTAQITREQITIIFFISFSLNKLEVVLYYQPCS